MITIRLDSERLRQAMQRLGQPSGYMRSVLAAAAGGVKRRLQAHFQQRNAQPNKLGGRRTHFWLDILKSTQIGEVNTTSATVIIGDQRFGQKVYGGTIVPKNVKWLTIPVVPEAHGKRAAVYERSAGIGLRFVPVSPTSALLVEAKANRVVRHKTGLYSGEPIGGRVVYVLKKSVTQAPDSNAMPDRPSMESEALREAEKQLAVEVERIGGRF